MYLFFDTETSDLPRDWKAPARNTRNWPRIIQIAWITCDSDGNQVSSASRLIRPNGFSIAPGAFQTHGISTEFAEKHGEPLLPILDDFTKAAGTAEVLVAHNMNFDSRVLSAEYIRSKIKSPITGKSQRCTMKESTDHCRIPGSYGYKWPKLSELHSILFGKDFDGAHDAASDTAACMRCYFRLKELGVMG